MLAAHAKVREWRRLFRGNPLAAGVIAGLHKRSAEIWQRTFDLLQQESPEYRNSVDEEFTQESRSHCRELLNAIIAVAAGRTAKTTDPFAFVRTHAEWRARHSVPLVASLHAYRLAHKTYWNITRESLLRHEERDEALHSLALLSDFWMEFFDYVGAVLAEAHAAEEGLTAAPGTPVYDALMDDLLRGREPKGADARRLAILCGLQSGAPMAVAVARTLQSGNGKLIDLDVTRRSLVRLVHEVLPSAVFGKLVAIRNDEVQVIVSSAAESGRGFVKALRRQGFGRRAANGLAAGVGVGRDTVEVAGLPASLEEARAALEFSSAPQPLMHFADIDLPEFLIRRADKTALRLIPDWTARLTGDLAKTIRAFAECSLNVKQTARRLGVHTNTVYFRLNRIYKVTGVDPRTFAGTSLLLTSLRLLEVLVGRPILAASPPPGRLVQ